MRIDPHPKPNDFGLGHRIADPQICTLVEKMGFQIDWLDKWSLTEITDAEGIPVNG